MTRHAGKSGLNFVGSALVRKDDSDLRANLRKVFSIWTTRVILQKLLIKPHLSGLIVHVYRQKVRTGYRYSYDFRRPIKGGCSCGEPNCLSNASAKPLWVGKRLPVPADQENASEVLWQQLASEGLVDGLWAAYVGLDAMGNPYFHLEQVAPPRLTALRQLCPYLGLGSTPQFAYEDFRARRLWLKKATAGCSA